MTSEQQLMEKWRKLTPPKQQQVIQFVELLESQDADDPEAIAQTLPTIELWSPHDSHAAAQDLLNLLETDPGEEFD